MEKRSRAKKILFGCLGGCGFVLLITIGSCVGFTIWLNSPGEVLQPEVLLGTDTTGYVEWTLRLEDPGTAEFTEALLKNIDKINRRQNSVLPDGLQHLINSQQMKSTRKDIKKFFPLVVAWIERPDDDPGLDEHLFSVSARGLGHQLILADWLMGFFLGRIEDVTIERYDGEKIYKLSEFRGIRPVFFINKGIVFGATDVESARQTLDRLALPAARTHATTELEDLFDALPADRPLRGAVTNRNGELTRILDALRVPSEHEARAAWAEVRGATISAGFRGETTFAGAVELLGPHAAWGEANASTLGAGVKDLFEDLEIEFGTEVLAAGDRVRVEFSTVDLFGELERAIEERD